MRKNSGPIKVSLGVDEITGDYMIDLPEFLINDMGWYEGTVLELRVDGNDLVIEKAEEDWQVAIYDVIIVKSNI